MPLITVNSDPEKLWGDQLNIVTDLAVTLPETILAGEAAEITIVGTNVAGLTVVLDPEEITCDGADILINSSTEDGAVGTVTFANTGSAELTIGYGDVTVTEEVTVTEAPVRSISFDSATYLLGGDEGNILPADFPVTTDKGGDVTADCTYTQSPANTGLVVDGTTGNIDPNAVPAGDYTVNVTATYGNLTATCTVAMHVEVPLRSISFDSATYTLSGTEGDAITGSFSVTTNRGDDVTADCTYTLNPGNTGLTASAGSLDASAVAAGTYSVTLTANYGNMTATATVSMEIAAAVSYITFADPAVKAICVQNWGSDGEITEEQAAAVTSIGTVFMSNTTITSFNELSYFTGLTGIPTNAFKGCTNLASVTIPTGVISIGQTAFQSCTNLSDLTLPSTLTSIGNYAFQYCTTSKNVYISDLAAWCSLNFDNTNKHPCGASGSNRLFLNGTEVTALSIPSTVTAIKQRAFYKFHYITSVTIPNSVTSIGERAFYYCSGLTSFTIPDSVTNINQDAFQGCTGLTSIAVDSGNSYYDSRDNCNAIIHTSDNTLLFGCKNTVIPSTVTTIGESAFQDCTVLTSITIPNSVTTIGESAFAGCTGLTSITIPNSVTTIGNYAFHSCSGLTSVTIGNSVTSIGERAFFKCSSLTSVTIPNSVTSIPKEAFYECTGLTAVTYPSTLTSIGKSAFQGCTGLTVVDLSGTSVATIGQDGYRGCRINSFDLPSTLTSIGNGAIDGDAYRHLHSITCRATTPPTLMTSFGTIANDFRIYVPSASVDAYKAATNWSTYAAKITAIPA